MPLTKSETKFEATKITLHIQKPASQVLERLHSSISVKSRNGLDITNHTASREDFETTVKSHVGPHGFMHFATIEHGDWMGLYGVHERKSATRIVFGNPLIAITMLEHDVEAGLFAPVEAIVVDLGEGRGTDVVYVKPSDLIFGGKEDGKLAKAARALDAKLEVLWEWVAEQGM